MRKRFFVTSTDAGADKAFVTLGLLRAAKRAETRAVGLMPVSTGAQQVDGVLRNKEALLFQQESSVCLPYEQINPVAFKGATVPYLAAMQENKLITVSRLEGYIKGALLTPNELAFVEGVGGWKVPLNDRECLSDVAKLLGFPVILVVNLSDNCLNYARLTAEAILRDGLLIAGVIVCKGHKSSLDDGESIAVLAKILPVPLLGVVSSCEDDDLSDHQFDKLLAAL